MIIIIFAFISVTPVAVQPIPTPFEAPAANLIGYISVGLMGVALLGLLILDKTSLVKSAVVLKKNIASIIQHLRKR